MIAYELFRKRPAAPPPATPVVAQPIHQQSPAWHSMGKHKYAEFLNEFVYPKFKKGMYVTFKHVPIVLNEAPKLAVVHRVHSIQEVHYMVQMALAEKEPRAVGITLINSEWDIPVYYPPSLLRPLELFEVEEIDKLRNQTTDSTEQSS